MLRPVQLARTAPLLTLKDALPLWTVCAEAGIADTRENDITTNAFA